MVPNWKIQILSSDELVLKRVEKIRLGGLKLYIIQLEEIANNWGLKLDLDDKFIYKSFESEEIMEKIFVGY